MATDSEIKSEKLAKAREVNENRNKARLEMMESIADGSDSAREDEMQDHDGDKIVLVEKSNNIDVDKARETAEAAEAAEAEAAAAAEAAASETTEETEVVATTEEEEDTTTTTVEEELPTDERVVNGIRHYLTIVNGKERWLTKNQLIEKAQKVESADEYLSNAAETVRKVSRPDLSLEDDAGKVDTSQEDDDLEKTLSSAVLGDQEAVKKIASAFSSLRADLREAKKTQPSVTPDVVKEIDSRLAFRNAVEWFEGEYSKELSDPFLKQLIYDKDQKLSSEQPALSYKARLKMAGDEVRTWIRGQKGIQAKPSPEKVERKKTLVNVPGASQRQAVKTEEDEEESPEQAIAAMAKARGQARAIVHRGPLNK